MLTFGIEDDLRHVYLNGEILYSFHSHISGLFRDYAVGKDCPSWLPDAWSVTYEGLQHRELTPNQIDGVMLFLTGKADALATIEGFKL